jgi:hypothetical protein
MCFASGWRARNREMTSMTCLIAAKSIAIGGAPAPHNHTFLFILVFADRAMAVNTIGPEISLLLRAPSGLQHKADAMFPPRRPRTRPNNS